MFLTRPFTLRVILMPDSDGSTHSAQRAVSLPNASNADRTERSQRHFMGPLTFNRAKQTAEQPVGIEAVTVHGSMNRTTDAGHKSQFRFWTFQPNPQAAFGLSHKRRLSLRFLSI